MKQDIELLQLGFRNLRQIFAAEEAMKEAMLKLGSSDFNSVSYDKLETMLITFLEKAFQDKNEWISYYVYECDFGNKPKRVQFPNKKSLRLSSINQLYKLLTNSYE